LTTAFLVAACASVTASAVQYPSRPVRMIVPFSPGGASDTAARVLSRYLIPRLKQQIVIDNRTGAAGTIGAEIAARATPDGYTLLMGSSGEVMNPALHRNLPYDSARDFRPISLVAYTPLIVVVHPSVSVHSIQDLIALAKSRPDGLDYASSGNGAGVHLGTELFKSMTGVRMRHIPFKGGAPGLTSTIAGETQVMFVAMPLGLPQSRAGKVRALAVTSATRVSAAPELPTVAEAGLSGYELVIWNGLMAPAGTPKPILDRLYAETVAIIALPEVKQRFTDLGTEAASSTPEEFSKLMRIELAKYIKLVKDAGIKID
jgi:tripartite-type tricarboxylate transporter receptor subunit TctC